MTHTPPPPTRIAALRRGPRTLPLATSVMALVLVLSGLLGSSAAGAARRVTPAESAGAALDWLAQELTDNGGTLPGPAPGSTDWGLGADAALALLLHGRGGGPATAALVDAVLSALDEYTTWDSLGAQYAGVRLAGPLAKALLVAETAQRPTTVGSLDLVGELESLMATSGAGAGRFGDRNPHGSDGANLIGQSLAILALSHQPEGPPTAAVTFLLSRQCPGGGFPLQSAPGPCDDDADADPDATALALDALRCAPPGDEVDDGLSRAVGWLLGRADAATGAFGGVGPTAGLNANSTGLIGHALGVAGQAEAAGRAAAWVTEELQLGADAADTPATGEVGAIAYNPDGRGAALATGIDPLLRDQWRRAGTQAVLALGAAPFGVPADDAPVVPATTTTTTAPSTTTTTAAPSTTTTAAGPASTTTTTPPATQPAVAGATADADGTEALAVTGSRSATMVLAGIALLLAGSVALIGARAGAGAGARRGVGIVVLLGGLGAAVLGSPPGADAAPGVYGAAATGSEGPCPGAEGVTVIVDFGALGGGVHVRCAPGAPSSGFDALDRAGVDYDTALRSGGFLCRIAGKPATDPCIDPSPASAHWSYWLAERGGAWCYSNLGAGNRRPPQGTVEGWSFVQGSGAGDAHPPTLAPPAAVAGAGSLAGTDCDRSRTAPTAPPTTTAPSPAPGSAQPSGQPSTQPTPAPAPAAPAPPSTLGGSAGSAPTPGAAPATPDTTVAESTTTSSLPGGADAPPAPGDASPSGSGGSGSEDATAAEPATDRVSARELSEGTDEAGGSAFGTAVAVVGVTGLAAGSILLRRRRRRSEPSEDSLSPPTPGPPAAEPAAPGPLTP
jgi:hypothetical protein